MDIDFRKININEQLKLLLARQDILTYIVMALLILFASTKFYSFQTRKIELAREARSEENKRVDLLSGLVRIEQEVSSYQKFFSKEEQLKIIGAISDIAREEGVRVNSIQPLDIAKEGLLTKAGFSISLEAKYHAIGKFVNRLERSASFFRIEKLTLTQRAGSYSDTQPDKESEGGVLLTNMQLSMLYTE